MKHVRNGNYLIQDETFAHTGNIVAVVFCCSSSSAFEYRVDRKPFLICLRILDVSNTMNNQITIPKNLPLKKRRAYMFETTTANTEPNDGNCSVQPAPPRRNHPLRIQLPSAVSSPPLSPHIEALMGQQPTKFSTSNKNLSPTIFFSQSMYECPLVQRVLVQQYLNHYQESFEPQQFSGRSAYDL